MGQFVRKACHLEHDGPTDSTKERKRQDHDWKSRPGRMPVGGTRPTDVFT
jgi:hypothetical protein